MLIPALWGFFNDSDAFLFITAGSLITAAVGILLIKLFHSRKTELNLREALLLVSLSWFAIGLFGCIPFVFAGLPPVDAFFESVSGFTTTGATILTDIERLDPALHLWRSMTQWLGGMGVILLFVAVVFSLRGGAMRLIQTEAPGPSPQRLSPRANDTARVLWRIYVLLSFVQFLLLWTAGLSPYEAIVHVFTTMPTGGFSTEAESIAGLGNPVAEWIIIVFMILAGTNFALFHQLWQRRRLNVFVDSGEWRFYIATLGTATVVVFSSLVIQMDAGWQEGIRQAAFQVVSVVTTTGYATSDFAIWSPFAQAVLLVLFFTGGMAGSTGGSIKQIRVLVLLRHIQREFKRFLHPDAVLPLRTGSITLPERLVHNILGFIGIYAVLMASGFLMLTATGLDMVTAFTASASSLGNIGPGFAGVGPMENYASIHPGGKIMLSFLMIAGRLEIFPLAIFFSGNLRRKVNLKGFLRFGPSSQ